MATSASPTSPSRIRSLPSKISKVIETSYSPTNSKCIIRLMLLIFSGIIPKFTALRKPEIDVVLCGV